MEEKLRELYIEKEFSIREIADELGISYSGARHRLIKNEIPLRTSNQGMNTGRNRNTRSLNSSGRSNSQWKGGKRVASHGYVEVYKPDHPYASSRNTVYEHRLVMEEVVGRYLTTEESVHHIDENKQNNAPENLMLFESESEHQKYHQKMKRNQFAS